MLLGLLDPGFVKTLALRGFDLEQQLSPRRYEPLRVRIVAIDEKSLARYGQWPWPRTLIAKLVQQIGKGHPLVLGVDIIFAEPDRMSPGRLVDAVPDLPGPMVHELGLLPSNDSVLADAIRTVPSALAIGVSDKAEPTTKSPVRVTIVREYGRDPRPWLSTYPYFLRSLPELTNAASGQGVVVGNPDQDGISRRFPLYVVGQGQLMPALSLEMLRVAAGAGTLGITTSRDGVVGGSMDGVFIPTDTRGRVYPHFTRSYQIRYLSAADVLDQSYDVSEFKGGIVLLGAIGEGLVDQMQTPLGLMAGVEVHAQVIECILTGSLLRRPARLYPIEIAIVLIAGLIVIFVIPYERPQIAGAEFAALIVLLCGSAFICFRFFNLLVDAIYPSVTAIAAFGVMLVASLRAAEAARRHLAADLERERQIEARLEGELNAARSIQMGLLPHKFPGPPSHREVDLYALIEPARMVGGDLYDFLLLDSERLFFAIADVSGKGVPAALFMAMTKEVLRDAVARYGEALDRAFSEANLKVSAASGDLPDAGGNMMFVTVFAGILNLSSGKAVYVNAGHDSPIVVRPGMEPEELAAEGGPPLGTVDDFEYPVGHYNLARGDLLLLYTDGVTEAESSDDSFYTAKRLEGLLRSAQLSDAKALVELVCEDVHRFAAGRAEQADDLTLLALHWIGSESAIS